MSNTLYFEKKGWKTLCIEPNPELFRQLVQNRAFAVQAAVGAYNHTADFTVVTLEGGNQTAVSALTVDKRLLASHVSYKPSLSVITTPVKTLDTLLKDFPWIDRIDFISIDTEGTELDVLKGFDIDRWRPKLFIIENNFNDPEVENYLRNFNYRKIKRIAVNDFYRCIEAK